MAREIEIAFSAIRNHRDVRNLKVLEKGLYFALVQACILDGIDPLPYAAPRTLAHLAGATSQQWIRGKRGALKALESTLEVLKARYNSAKQSRDKRANAAKQSFSNSYLHRRLAVAAKANLGDEAKVFIQDQSFAPSILQPIFKEKFRAPTVDLQARELAKKSISTGKRLTDKN